MTPAKRRNDSAVAWVREDMLNGMGKETRPLTIAFSASLVCHLIIFSVLIFMQTHSISRRPVESFISVSLVSLPGPAAPAKKKEAAPAPAPKPKEAAAPPKTEQVSTQPEKKEADVSLAPKEKISLKKKTFKSESVKKNTLEKLEQKVETDSSERIARAIDELKSKVEQTDAENRSKPVREAADAAAGSEATGDGKDAAGRRAELIDIYRVEVAFQIQKNWAFAEQLAEGRSDLQTLLVFKIMPNGEIKDLFFTDRSGNRNFDESAYRAVMKSNPVAPHPKGIAEPFVEMGLRFTPEGIQ